MEIQQYEIGDITRNTDEQRIALSVLNHELRNPLSVIKVYAQMLERSDKTRTTFTNGNASAVILRQIEGITRLLDQYLTCPSGSENILQLNCSLFNLEHLLDQVLNDLKHLHKDRIFIKKCSIPAIVRADKYKITQVLINYLTNAVKFSPKYSMITVSIHQNERGVQVGVADEGPGVPRGSERVIYEKFYRLGPDGEENTGSGLGLYLIKQIIDCHGGCVGVQHRVTGGSLFFFSLPSLVDNSLEEQQ